MAAREPDSQGEQVGRIINEFLDRRNAGDPVSEEELLAAHPDLADVLRGHFEMLRQMPAETALTPPGGWGEPFSTIPQDSFPGYSITREIHRGGQGVVYQAIQKSTKQKVAIKVMKEGPFAGPRDKSRFEREVQILGALKHPNIVAIHDSGVASGNFFFVMDYISGQPLEVWMAAKERPIEEILRLFSKICEAVNAAHLKGVIHRDLKPGNIRIDEQGEPHVLDFGLAKMALSQVTDDSRPQAMTVTGQFVGSLPWASPEQAEGLPDKIDTRTDVYSLGVILYQMLTGKFPYDVVGNMRDVLDRILKSEPARPSTIRRQINDEVETIVLKCLSKERERRYQTAGELGRDIGHYLAGEPIEAKRNSGLYVLRTALRRYRVPVAVSVLGLISLATTAVIFILMATTNKRLATESELARIDADRGRVQAKEAETRAAAAATQAEAERDEAVRQRNVSEVLQYAGILSAAEVALARADLVGARRFLDAAAQAHRNWEWRYLDSYRPVHISTLDHASAVTCVAFSLDGKVLATGTGEHGARLWDMETFSELMTLGPEPYRVHSLCFSPDGKRIVVGLSDGSARVWELTTGREVAVMQGQACAFESMVCSYSGRWVATASANAVTLWDIASGAEVRTFVGHAARVRTIAFSPDDKWIITGSADATAKLWDAVTGAEVRTLRGHREIVDISAFSPDSTRIITGSKDRVVVWDTATGAPMLALRPPTRRYTGFLEELKHCLEYWSTCVAISSDGKWIATGSHDRTAKLWVASTGSEIATLSGHAGDVSSVAFSRDGRWIATGSDDKTARLWDAGMCSGRSVLSASIASSEAARTGVGVISAVGFSPDSRWIVTGAEDKTATLWDAASGARVRVFSGHTGLVSSVAFSSDGKLLATVSVDKSVKLWSMATGAEIVTLRGHAGWISSTSFSPNGASIVTGSADRTARVWSVASGVILRTLYGHIGPVTSVQFSPDAGFIATGSVDRTAKLWNASTGSEVMTLSGHTDYVSSVAFSPNGKSIITGSGDKTAVVWDSISGRSINTLSGHIGPVSCVAFSPDGKRVMTGSGDTTVKLWDAGAGVELLTLRGHTDAVSSAAFSGDGQKILTGSHDGTAVLWHRYHYVDGEMASEGVVRSDLLGPQREVPFEAHRLYEFLAHSKGKAQRIIEITSSSEVPAIADVSDQTAFAGRVYTYTPTLLQGIGGAPVTWEIASRPAADMAIDRNDGTVSWFSPTVGTHVIEIVAMSPVGIDDESWTLTVLESPQPQQPVGPSTASAPCDMAH